MSAPVFLSMDRDACLVELERLDALEAESRKNGFMIDADGYRGYSDAIRDALDGVKRCPTCGRKKPSRKNSS